MMQTSIALGIYETIGDSGEVYRTDRLNKTCNCKSWYYGKRPCKHLIQLGVKDDCQD